MSEDSFLREVEEELRSEKLRNFWKRYAVYIIGAAVLVVVLVAANEVWKWWRDSTATAASERYYSAVALADGGDVASAEAALSAIASDGTAGYATLAQFRSAALLAEEGNFDAALSTYDALSSSLNEARLRELALILGAYLAVDHFDVAAVQTRAGALTGDDNPMRNLAREAMGLAYYKAGDYENARTSFEAIVGDFNAPQEIQLRAFVYLEQLASTGVTVSQDIIDPEAEPTDLGLEVPALPQ